MTCARKGLTSFSSVVKLEMRLDDADDALQREKMIDAHNCRHNVQCSTHWFQKPPKV